MDAHTVEILLLLGALVYLWLTVNRLRQAVQRLEQGTNPPPVPDPAAAAPSLPLPRPAANAVDAHIVAAIAAAVSVVLKRPHRIVALRPDPSAQQAWSAEGRREIYLSHKIR